MNTNKTLIAIYDHSDDSPIYVNLKLEFEIYQDAIDYVETFANDANSNLGATNLKIYLYSYDFNSYSYWISGGTVTKSSITFPDLVG